jgi:hypothetical protein
MFYGGYNTYNGNNNSQLKTTVKKYVLKKIEKKLLSDEINGKEPHELLKKIVETNLYTVSDDGHKIPIEVDERFNDNIDLKKIPLNEEVPDELCNDENKKCSPYVNCVFGSCIPLNVLILMSIAHNEISDKKIILFDKILTNSEPNYKIYLVKQFENIYGKIHKKWLNEPFIKKLSPKIQEILKTQIFRTQGPLDNEWLNNIQINDTMTLYEPIYKNFVYLKTLPRDFYNYLKYDVDFDKHLEEDQYKFGMVINSDKHNQGGSHWKMLYFDTKYGLIIYIDSGGSKPEKEIQDFIEYISDYLKSKNIPVRYYINDFQFQHGDTECGVFSMYFLNRILEMSISDPTYQNNPLKILQEEKITDEQVQKWRNVFFSKY